jgi:hypothetical protein
MHMNQELQIFCSILFQHSSDAFHIESVTLKQLKLTYRKRPTDYESIMLYSVIVWLLILSEEHELYIVVILIVFMASLCLSMMIYFFVVRDFFHAPYPTSVRSNFF